MKLNNDSVSFSNGEIAWELRRYPIYSDESGELGVFEFAKDFDFNAKRIFFYATSRVVKEEVSMLIKI